MHAYINYDTLEILIGQKLDQGYPITVIQSPSGDATAISPLNPHDPELQEALDALAMDNMDHDLLTKLGIHLFNAIFHEDILICYRKSLSAVNTQNRALRLLLRLEPPELTTIPWEYLYDPTEQMFLAIGQETPLARYQSADSPARSIACKPPLRLLVIIANPVDFEALDVEQEKRIIDEVLANRIRAEQIELRFIEVATVKNINEAMREFKPHIFHFVGHSIFQDGVASIVLEDDVGRAKTITDHTFKTFFNGAKETRLVVLNSCQGAARSDSQKFAGLVPHLFHNKLSAIVAMQYPLTDQASLIFVREFYRELANSGFVEAATSRARMGIYQATNGQGSEWGTPVLYLRVRENQLIQWPIIPIEIPPLSEPEPPSPLKPEPPPKVANFVGRSQELVRYQHHLNESGIVLIVGMAGVGKSTLAAELASRTVSWRQTFWYRFTPEESDILAFIWKIAGFLAWNGETMLWNKLHHDSEKDQLLPSLDTIIDQTVTLVQQGRYLFCLDDFQFVDENPQMKNFIHKLQTTLYDSRLKIIITSREVLSVTGSYAPGNLAGLTEVECTHFLKLHNLSLPAELDKALHKRTEGNAELLILAATLLQKVPDPQKIIGQLTQTVDIEQYLLKEVDSALNDNERDIMGSVAVLLGQGSADMIETVSGKNVRRDLADLTKHSLLTISQSETGREYIQHGLLQEFYYNLLSYRKRLEMHSRAADYYHDKKQDRYKALWHYHKGNRDDAAIALLDDNIWPLTYYGRLHSLYTILTEIAEKKLTPEQQAIVLIAQAQLDGYLGEVKIAEKRYGQADLILAQEPHTWDIQKRTAKIASGMAFLLQGNTPRKALGWAQRGLRLIMDKNDRLEAELLTMQGCILRSLGKIDEGIKTLKQALAIQNTHPTRQRLLTLLALGRSYYNLGDLEKMYNYLIQAEEMGEILHDYNSLLAIRGCLAVYHQAQGHVDQASATYELALQSVNEVSAIREVINLQLNYGYLLIQRQAFEAAYKQIQLALEKARSIGYIEAIVTSQCRLTLLYLDSFEQAYLWEEVDPLGAAETALAEATLLTEERNIAYHVPNIHWLKARLHWIKGAPTQAEDEAKKSLDTAQQQGMLINEGRAWRLLGLLQLEQGERAEAILMLKKSLTSLHDSPYERTLTEAQLTQAQRVDE